jgi:hypothetical protein
LIVGQFHHVEETVVATADVENIHLAIVLAGNWLKLEDARELALERAVMVEGPPLHDLDGPVSPGHAARQPNFSITATSNAPEQLMIGNGRRLQVFRRAKLRWDLWFGIAFDN